MEKVNSHFQRRWDLPLCVTWGKRGSSCPSVEGGPWCLGLPTAEFFWVEESTVEVLCVVWERRGAPEQLLEKSVLRVSFRN